ncbi:hypothetical protein PMAYCL1PPCAC_24983, partial [Pristionchus mayeri]
MNDNPNFVFRWEVDTSTLETGKVESKVFNEGGFKWTASIEKFHLNGQDLGRIVVKCAGNNKGPWKCEADVEMMWHHSIGFIVPYGGKSKSFNEGNSSLEHHSVIWSCLLNPKAYSIDNKAIVEFQIRITNSEGCIPIAEPCKFTAPNHRSDVILKIGEEKLHVSREYLAIHSPVFETLFFGDFTSKDKEEVEINDVVYEEFLDLLNLIYPREAKITDRTVLHILKLADRFEMKNMVKEAEEYLMQSTGFDEMEKLLFSNQYGLAALK